MKRVAKRLLIGVLVFTYQTKIYGQDSCAREVEDLARMHIGLDQDPGGFLPELLGSAALGAVAGHGLNYINDRTRTKSALYKRQRFQDLRDLIKKRNALMAETRKLLIKMGSVHKALYMPNQFLGFKPKTYGKNNLATVDGYKTSVDRLMNFHGIKNATPAQVDKLRELFRTTYPVVAQVDTLQTDFRRHYHSRMAARPAFRRMRGAMAGGILGVVASQGIRRLAVTPSCGPFGIEGLHNFTSTVSDTFSGENRCFLTVDGASDILDKPGEAQKLCDNYPQIREAMRNSFDLYAQGLVDVMADKQDALREAEFTCSPHEPDYNHMKIPVGPHEVKVEFLDDGARFEFMMTGSQAGHNEGRVRMTEETLPTFENSSGLRLRNGMGDVIDYRSLSHYFINTPGAPQNPILYRRYLTGAAIVAATLYRSEFDKACPKGIHSSSNGEIETRL